MEDINVEQSFNASVERVWSAWTDSAQLCPWFALKANVVPKRGEPYELFWDPENPERMSTLGCRITFMQPQRWLGFTWRGPTIFDDFMNENAVPPPPPTHVTVSFVANGEQTIVHVSHTGWLDGARWAEAHAWHVRAWKAVFENLAAFLEGRELPVDWSAQPQHAQPSEKSHLGRIQKPAVEVCH